MYLRATSYPLSLLRFLAVCAVLLLGVVKEGYGQDRQYLNGEVNPSNNGGIFGVGGELLNPNYAKNGSGIDIDYAQLTARKTLVLNGGARLHIRNTDNTNFLKNSAVFFYIKTEPEVSGLSLNLGGLLGAKAFSISGGVFQGASNPDPGGLGGLGAKTNFGNPQPSIDQILLDKNGEYYLSVTPTTSSDFNAVRLTTEMSSSLLDVVTVAATTSVRVYNVFQTIEGGPCSTKPIFTDPGQQTGINIDLSGLQLFNLGDLIKQPDFAIDENPNTTYSEISPALVSAVGSLSQTFFFNHNTSVSDGVKFKLSLPTGLLDLGLLTNISFQAYNNFTAVGSQIPLSEALLGIDLLNIPVLGDNYIEPFDVLIKPNQIFNKIKVTFNTFVGLSTNNSLRIYDVILAPSRPEIVNPSDHPENTTICETEIASFTITATVPGDGAITYQWQYFDGTSWVQASGVNNQTTYKYINTPLSFNGRRYRVAITGGISGCEQTIYSNEAILTVTELPGKPHLTITDVQN